MVAAGDEATAVRAAADGAHVLTPWETPDGALWSVTFRPLLPDESTCADRACALEDRASDQTVAGRRRSASTPSCCSTVASGCTDDVEL